MPEFKQKYFRVKADIPNMAYVQQLLTELAEDGNISFLELKKCPKGFLDPKGVVAPVQVKPIELPKHDFITEDGVGISFQKELLFWATSISDKWCRAADIRLYPGHLVYWNDTHSPYYQKYKVFSTLAACNKFLAEQNQPKPVPTPIQDPKEYIILEIKSPMYYYKLDIVNNIYQNTTVPGYRSFPFSSFYIGNGDKINSIQRCKDNQIFKVGDSLQHVANNWEGNHNTIITSIELINNQIVLKMSHNSVLLKNAVLLPKEIIESRQGYNYTIASFDASNTITSVRRTSDNTLFHIGNTITALNGQQSGKIIGITRYENTVHLCQKSNHITLSNALKVTS